MRARAANLSRVLAKYDWVLVLGSAPILLFPERFDLPVVSLGLLALLVPFALRFAAARRFFMRTPLDIPITCLLLTVPLSLYASANFATSLPKLTGLLFGIAAYFVVARLSADEQSLSPLLMFWFASAIGIALVGLVATEWTTKLAVVDQITSHIPRFLRGLSRTTGGGLNPNEIGGLMALFIPPVLSVLFVRNHRLRWFVWLAGLLLLGGLLVLTLSRSAIFGTAIGVALIATAQSRRVRRLALLGAAAVAIAVLAWGPGQVAGFMLGGEGTSSAFASLGFEARREVWSRALYAIQDFPFTGVGLNQFQPVVNLLYPFFLIGPDAQIFHAHNIYLQVAVDFGVGGLVAYIAVLTATSLAAAMAYCSLLNPLERMLVLGFAAGLLAHQIYGLTDAITLGSNYHFEWWMFLGLIAGLHLRARRASAYPARRWRIAAYEVFSIWVLGSLIAIAMVADNVLLGLGLAVLAGIACGLAAMLQFASSPERQSAAG